MGTPVGRGCCGSTEWDSSALPGGMARSGVAQVGGGRLLNADMYHC